MAHNQLPATLAPRLINREAAAAYAGVSPSSNSRNWRGTDRSRYEIAST
jgi:hypothetical protein